MIEQSIDRSLMGTTTPSQKWPECNGNQRVLHVPQIPSGLKILFFRIYLGAIFSQENRKTYKKMKQKRK